MLIDFYEKPTQQFLQVCERLLGMPDLGLDSVADFYAATWLADFPQGTTWHATGLDDGAEEFYAVIEYRAYRLVFNVATTTQLELILPKPTFQNADDRAKP